MTTTNIKTNQDVVEALGLKAPEEMGCAGIEPPSSPSDVLWQYTVNSKCSWIRSWYPRNFLHDDAAALALLDCFLSRHPDLITRLTGPMVGDESGDTERNCYRCIIYRNGGGPFLAMPCASRPTAITLAVVEAHRAMQGA